MTTNTTNETAANGAVSVGPAKVMRYEDYLAQRRAAQEENRQSIEAAAREAAEAQRRYQESLRALPPLPKSMTEPVFVTEATVAATQNGATRPETAEDELTDHNYDGIQEYDNPTPGWWYMLFVGTVIFSVFYVFIYHALVPSQSQRLAMHEARVLDEQFAELNEWEMGEAKVVKIMSEESWLARGETIFTQKCALCHLADGSGSVGPNLTDGVYKNMTNIPEMLSVITDGAAGGLMPAQRSLLNDNEIALVAAYVGALRGKDLPSVRPPEGVPIAPWPELDASGELVPVEWTPPAEDPQTQAPDESNQAEAQSTAPAAVSDDT